MGEGIIEWDKHGYPTEASLKRLKKALKSDDLSEAIDAFYDALEENYYPDCCGPAKVEVRGEIMDVWEYHTMGWSGNESIIAVLAQSWLWNIFLERYDKGGHYYFKPREKKDKDSKEKDSKE